MSAERHSGQESRDSRDDAARPDKADRPAMPSPPAAPAQRQRPESTGSHDPAAREPTESVSVTDFVTLEADQRRRPVALTILATLSVFYTVYLTRSLLFPVVLAVIFYFLFRPLVRWMSRRRVPDSAGAAVVVLSALAVAVTGVYFLFAPATAWVRGMPDTLRQAEGKFAPLLRQVQSVEQASEEVERITGEDEEVQIVEHRQPSLTTTILNTTGEVAAAVVITVVLLYLLLAFGDQFLNSVVQLRPTFRDKREVVALVRDIERGVSRYLVTVTIINICLGVAIGSVLWALGMPNPVLWGGLAGLLNFVPFIGALVGEVMVALVALVEFQSIGYALLAPLSYLVINTLEGNVITPLILGRSMSLSPLAVFLSLILWGWMWGIGGVLVAVPVLGMLKIICDRFPTLQPLSNLLGQSRVG
jgi:predicted PurR-regulated permease PerM